MGKKRFFDDRLKYLSFIQNTGEKKAISKQIYPSRFIHTFLIFHKINLISEF